MLAPEFRRFALAAAILLAAAHLAWAQQPLLTGAALAEALRQGGYVLLFRHAATDWSNRDEGRSRLDDCSTQRNLSEEGRADARRIGAAVRTLGVPIGAVWASPFCRTRETAQLAFGRVEPTRELLWPGNAAAESVKEQHRAGVRTRLGSAPRAGQNTVLVTHGFVIQAATDESLAEGEALVLQPGGGQQFRRVARIKPGDWADLSALPAQ
jgi:broad specificity phosphatase PhoE